MAIVTIDQAVLGYQNPVIGPISTTIDVGERVGILGPNGCGKSTLLNYFSGVSHLFSGSIHIKESVSIAYQPQRPVHPTEIPIIGSEYLKLMAADSESIPERLKLLLAKRVDQLSGGQFQILSTWANLASKGELVLLDEPTNNLDPEAIELLVDTILAMPESHGLMVVSHDSHFIQRIANKVVEIG